MGRTRIVLLAAALWFGAAGPDRDPAPGGGWIPAEGVQPEPAVPDGPGSANVLEVGEGTRRSHVPEWSHDAIWYQVFVARFANGDTGNDPPGTHPWTGDWPTAGDLSAAAAGRRTAAGDEDGGAALNSLRHELYHRRYGGDLAGLAAKLDYLRTLGINTLYLNPVFEAPSQHKYDTADHRHVDDSFGVSGSLLRLAGETSDPSTWQWSASDQVFLSLLAEAHAVDIRIVVDGVFNHVGRQFWAWRDVEAKGRASEYADWFDVTDWGPPLKWMAWDGPNGALPRFSRFGDGLHPEVEAYLFAVVRRWMDPDGDGDGRDGVDGWRLDAAEQAPHGFWKRFRRVVKELNPDCLIVGEIWTDASEWLAGDQFDVVTNYPFAAELLSFASQAESRDATEIWDGLEGLRRRHPRSVTLGMMNLLGSHDTERTVTMLQDAARSASTTGKIPFREVLTPDENAFRRLRLALLVQFTYPGAPMIYYGDEVGMYGGDDPFCRAPMWWSEEASPEMRGGLRRYFAGLCRLREERIELRRGDYRAILADDARRLLAFERSLGDRRALMVVNGDDAEHAIRLAIGRTAGAWEIRLRSSLDETSAAESGLLNVSSGDHLEMVCPPLAGVVIVQGPEKSPWE